MLYDANKIAEELNISKITAEIKLKLKELQPYITLENNNSFINEEGLEIIKQSLKYNETEQKEVAATEIETLKVDIIETLKNDLSFLKEQLYVKDSQIQDMKNLFENTQHLFLQEQEKNKFFLTLPEIIKERDLNIFNNITESIHRPSRKEIQEQRRREKRFFHRFFKKRNRHSIKK